MMDEAEICNCIEGWICYALFIREIRMKKYNWINRINHLNN